MKRLALALILLAVVTSAPMWEKAIPSRPTRLAIWGVFLLISVSLLVEPVVAKRREGKSWNDALTGDTKLMTGSVWLDGALFFVILLGTFGAVFAVFFLL